MGLAVGSISLVINTLEGYWLTPWLAGRASRMNGVVVFSGLLFWGWLWGGWGVVLGLPIMMVIKAICDQVERPQADRRVHGGVTVLRTSVTKYSVSAKHEIGIHRCCSYCSTTRAPTVALIFCATASSGTVK